MDDQQPFSQDGKDLIGLSTFGIVVSAMLAFAAIQGGDASPAAGKLRSADIYDEAFRNSLSHYDDEMRRVRPELSAVAGQTEIRVVNCIGFLNTINRADLGEQISGHRDAVRYADCLPLRTAHVSLSATNHLGPSRGLGRIVAERLDAVAARKYLPAWIKPTRRLGDAGADAVTVTDRAVTLTRGSESHTIQVMASVDVMRTGMEDLLVRITGSGDPAYAVLKQDKSGFLHSIDDRVLLMQTGLVPNDQAPAL